MQLQKPLIILAALTVAATIVGLVGVNLSQSIATHDQATVIRALASNSDALRQQVKDTGEIPIAPKADVVVDTPSAGVDGVQGLQGFTGEKGATGADGIQGIPGLPGAEGMSGLAGSSGLNGADSTTAGPTGATGADSTVPGPTGPTGPGIASIDCQTDGTWLFTLTDATTREVAGPCRVDPITPTIGATP